MLTLSKEKNEAIIAADTDRIGAITDREKELVKKTGKLEVERMELLERISGEKGQSIETIGQSIELAAGEEKDALKKNRDQLLLIIEEFKEVNEKNRQLLETHMQYSEFMLNLLTEATASNSYNSSGKEAADPTASYGSGLIDSEV